jgi:glycine betaine catabolism B
MRFILKYIDNFLNKTTMYKVVLYYLVVLWVIALVFSFFGILSYTPVSMLISLAILLAISYSTNYIFSYVFKVPTNLESIYISVFILALIITPALTPNEYIFLGWAGILAMSSKYIFAIKHKHIFNPVGFAVAVTAFFIYQSASWWIGTLVMTPFVLIGGLMIVRKIRRTDLALSFFVVALVSILTFSLLKGGNMYITLSKALFYSPLLFFTFIMITEPLTTPSSRILRILYGILVGFLFAPQMHIGRLYSTPELSLLAGNIFSYLVSSKKRLILKFKYAKQLTSDTSEFVFGSDMPIQFKSGQYLEWTLGHNKVDLRGNRRYFTIASSPTEKDIFLGVKFYEKPSSFKMALAKMNKGDLMIASQLSGDFVLPRNKEKKLVFIAGGIGITPFRSMIKYLIDTKEKRNIVLIYANKTEEDIAYKDILDLATKAFDLKVIYVISGLRNKTRQWTGRIGYIDEKMIQGEIKDFSERIFFISGPSSMVSDVKQTIKNMGVSSGHIKTDFFPGFA